jgi:hypothetical protein
VSGFSATWLALREPLDLAARNKEVEAAFFEALPAEDPKILDLASGAGSTVAALAGDKIGHSVDLCPTTMPIFCRWRPAVTTRQTWVASNSGNRSCGKP